MKCLATQEPKRGTHLKVKIRSPETNPYKIDKKRLQGRKWDIQEERLTVRFRPPESKSGYSKATRFLPWVSPTTFLKV